MAWQLTRAENLFLVALKQLSGQEGFDSRKARITQ
jgi:hypothetical protein